MATKKCTNCGKDFTPANPKHTICPACFKNQGKGKSGKSQQPKKCSMCPTFGRDGKIDSATGKTNPSPNDLPQERDACFECSPEYSISGHLTESDGKLQLVIQTYYNRNQVNIPFLLDIQGEDVVTIPDSDPLFQNGVYVNSIKPSSKKRKVMLHLVGAEADIVSLEIPASRKYFKPVEPDQRLTPKQNFWRSWRGNK